MAIQFLRGTSAQNNNYTGPEGSITVDITNWTIRLHDGTTAGGIVIGEMEDIGEATPSQAGLMSSSDKTKLNGIEAGAEKNDVTSVAGRSGAVSLNKSDIQDFDDSDYATAAQGDLAESSIQPGDTASTSSDGLMSRTDKAKLNGVETGAEKNAVTSVSGRTGSISLSKSDVGLGSVANYGVASQSQAESGSSNNLYMTPARVKAQIEAMNYTLDEGTL